MAEEITAKRFNVKGVNDDRDFCECCGKQGLKKVVWIEDSETGKVSHFGVVCASNPAKAFNVESEIKSAVAGFQSKLRVRYYVAMKLFRAAGGKFVSNGNPLADGGALIPADQALWQSSIEAAKQKISQS